MIIENIEKSNVFNFNQVQSVSEEIPAIQIKEIKDTYLDKLNAKTNDEEKSVSEDEVDEAIIDLEKFSNYFQTHLNFSKDESTGTTVVKIINSETDEIIRQIPSEEILKIASKMQEVIGVLFDQEY